MFRVRGNRVGIVDKKGKHLFSFGGIKCGLIQEELRIWADEVLQLLDGGMSVEDVKRWVDDNLGRW